MQTDSMMSWQTGNIITWVILAAYVVVLCFYLNAEKHNDGKNGFKKATALKLSLSGMFCAVAFISAYLLRYYSTRSDIYHYAQLFVAIALCLAFCGDYFLQYIRLDVKKYKIGIRFFMACQIVLIAVMCIIYRVWWPEFVIMVVVLLLVLLLMKKQNWQLGEEQKVVTAYTILLVFMASKAVVVMFEEKTVGTVLFAAGAVLFLVSDMFLGIWNYGTSKRRHANLNWITYFAGTMLIALSISPEYLGYIAY